MTTELRCSLYSLIMFVIGSTLLSLDNEQLSYSGISKFTLNCTKKKLLLSYLQLHTFFNAFIRFHNLPKILLSLKPFSFIFS